MYLTILEIFFYKNLAHNIIHLADKHLFVGKDLFVMIGEVARKYTLRQLAIQLCQD